MRQAIDNVSTTVMMIDRDFTITYINESTMNLLNEHAAHFRELVRDFDPSKILGINIDVFHKNPSHQRRLLTDPANLPHRAEIKVGPLIT
ncbi:PAS domain-containing protein [Breoghania sp.]|uniref:PAS domain-containing protein n=1 Tax=Breoghania sp. TaxID=2065378 RepID=UPI0026306C5D|nr:PAS domain-containing protein [Breoghania sp.]MDJ0933046.1 PAS domain-containing protein [Breoghania sp.]